MIEWITFSTRLGLYPEKPRSAELWSEWASAYQVPIRFKTHRRWRESVRALGRLDVSLRVAKSLLAAGWTPAEPVHGFVRGRSTLTGASMHVGSEVVLSVDLKNFFGQVSYSRVAAMLETRFDQEIREWVEGCCFVDDSLPLGLRTSPLLSNLAFDLTDYRIQKLAIDRGVNYSRWVDDLSFSGDGVDDRFLDDLKTLLVEENWVLNDSKTRFMRRSPYVLGLYVGRDADRPHLPNWMKRRLLLETYYFSQFGSSHFERPNVWSFARLQGLIAYAGVVDPSLAERLSGRLRQGARANR